MDTTIPVVTFKPNQRIWSKRFGSCKFIRYCTLVGQPKVLTGDAFIQVRGTDTPQRVSVTNIFESAPTSEQTWKANFQAHLDTICQSKTAYWVAGWLTTHKAHFNVSFPPDQHDRVIESFMKFGVDADDRALTNHGTNKTQGWSCSVQVDDFSTEYRDRLEAEAGVHSSRYFDTGLVSLQTRNFVLGFLGGVLKFRIGNGLEENDSNRIMEHVPVEHQDAFLAGVFGENRDFGVVVPMDPTLVEEPVAIAA